MLALREITYTDIFFRIVLATLIGGVLGLERGRKNRPAGLRTYMLVCLGSAAVMMTNQYVVQCMGAGDPVRMGAQVISGIGFLGAGSIMVTRRNQIRGITTAAGLWAAACLGLAVGIGFYELAVPGALAVFGILTAIHKFDDLSRKNSNAMDVFIELKSKESMPAFIHYMRSAGLNISNLQLEHEMFSAGGSFTFIATIKSVERRPRESIFDTLHHIPDLEYIEEL